MQCDDAWPRDVLDVAAMELKVEVEQPRRRRLGARLLGQLAVHVAQLLDELFPPIGRQRGRLPRREPFEMPNDEKYLAPVAARERCDDEALVARSSTDATNPSCCRRGGRSAPAFGSSPSGATTARSAIRARAKLARDDERAQLMIHARDIVDRLVLGGRAGSRRRFGGLEPESC